MEIDKTIEFLKKNSRRSALFSLFGIVLVIAALVFSIYFANQKRREIVRLDEDIKRLGKDKEILTDEIAGKKAELDRVDKALAERNKIIDLTEAECPECVEKAVLEVKNDEKKPDVPDVPVNKSTDYPANSIADTPKNSNSNSNSNTSVDTQGGVRLATARTEERKGFQSMLAGDYDAAIEAFEAADEAYPTYNNAYELARILRRNKTQMKDEARKKEVFKTIAEQYSYRAPKDLLEKVRADANK